MPYSSASTYISPTLHIATYRVARELGGVTEGVATGGSTTTIVDTRILTQADDFYNQGMAWILRDSAEAAGAPEGQFGEITDFDNGTSTATVGDISAGSGNPFTVAPAAGDRYALTTSKYPPHQLIFAVNAALQDMGVIPYVDISSITTASTQTEYSLPIAANMDLREVYLQGKLSDTNDYRWNKIQNWHIQRTAIGTADLLVLPFQYVTGRLLKLVYMQEHPELDDASDKISESVHLDRLVTEAALRMLEWRDNQSSNDPAIGRQMDRFMMRGADGLNKIERARANHPIFAPPRQSKLLILGRRIKPDQFTYPDPP